MGLAYLLYANNGGSGRKNVTILRFHLQKYALCGLPLAPILPDLIRLPGILKLSQYLINEYQ